MNLVDWEEAPEGATHYGQEGGLYLECWYKRADHNWLFATAVTDWEWVSSMLPPTRERLNALIARPPEAPTWNGEGLPPVGTVCYCGTHDREVEILQMRQTPYASAACRATDNNELFWGGDFRPIPTPEQLAAEARAKTIAEMAMIGCIADSPRSHSEKLYDAGYRLTKQDGE